MIEQYESSEELNVPDEFSEDAFDDIGYDEQSDRYVPRDSISSRGGGAARRGTDRKIPAPYTQQHDRNSKNDMSKEKETKMYKEDDPNEQSQDPKSESVISEYVSEKI